MPVSRVLHKLTGRALGLAGAKWHWLPHSHATPLDPGWKKNGQSASKHLRPSRHTQLTRQAIAYCFDIS